MLKSMTGYGRATSTGDDYVVEAEMRSVNGRFLKIHAKLPPQLTRFEASVEKVVKACFSRGTVDVYLKCERLSNPGGYVFNAQAARGYWQQLQKLKEEFGLEGKVSFELLSTLPGVLVATEESDAEVEKLTPRIEEAVRGAAENAARMRQAEGAELCNDLENHIKTVEELLDGIKARTPQALDEYKARFTERVAQLLDGIELDLQDQALAREVVFYIERSDMSEEIARMGSHVLQFRKIMGTGGAVGRQLEFLGQEMHREANTMGSKSSDAELSARITALKTTVDKIREQVLNIE